MEPERNRFRRHALDAAVITAPLAALYLRTLCRDLGTIDSGELAAVASSLGVAHPTGYPLYTLLARLSVMMLPLPPILAVNLLSAACVLAACVVVGRLTEELWAEGGFPRFAPWAAGLWFGTDAVVWDQATGNEVYGLHLLFVALVLRQSLRLLRKEAGVRDLLLWGYVAGLAAAHHLSIVFLAPAALLALAFHLRGGARPGRGRPDPWRAAPRLIAIAAVPAMLAWSVVLFLPLRAARHPLLDWGAPVTPDAFWRHILAAQYRVWLFESGRLWVIHFTSYLGSLPGRLSIPVLLLAAAGGWALARSSARRLAVLALGFVVTVAWAASYDIHDLAPYYLPADLVIVVLAVYGLAFLLRIAGAGRALVRRPVRAAVPVAILLLTVGWQGVAHFRSCDRKDDHFVRAHTTALLESLPPRTVLLSRHWDALVSAALYLQSVEKLRPDVTVVDPELLRRSWYAPQLRLRDPALLAPIEDRVSAFRAQAALFETGGGYDPNLIESSYRALIEGIAQAHRPERPTAFTPDVEAGFLRNAAPVPEGLVFVLRDDPAKSPPSGPPDVKRLLAAGYRPADRIHVQIVDAWAQLFASRIRFLEAMGRVGEVPPWERGLEQLQSARNAARPFETGADADGRTD